MQLRLSSEEDRAYIKEIQDSWCLLLDKLERMYKRHELFLSSLLNLATEHSLSLEEFVHCLLEPPGGQHNHSVTINKHQLVERYETTIKDLIHRFPSFVGRKNEQRSLAQLSQASSVTRSPEFPTSINHHHHHHHQQQQQQQLEQQRLREEQRQRSISQYQSDPCGSRPMQQGDGKQKPLLPTLPP